MGWFDLSTLKEPYRIEGKKTMGLELAEQLGWQVPDAIFYPTGGGTGLIGMWKAFAELRRWLHRQEAPAHGGGAGRRRAPIVRAFEAGEETRHAGRTRRQSPQESACRRPLATFSFCGRCVRARLRHCDTDEEITAALDEMAREEGFLLCPEGAATYAAYKQSLADGRVKRTDQVVLFNCASGLKYPLPPMHRTLDRHKAIDFASL